MNGRNPLWTFSGVRQAAWLFFAFLYIPILVLVVLSFNSGQSATLWESFSLKWYAVVANDPEILRAAKNSLLVATLATLASTVLATLAALGMRGRAFRGQTLMNGVLGLPLLVPEIVTAVATLMFFSFIGLKLSLLTILIAHIVFCIPFAYLPIRARLEGLDPRLAEAAADLYASPSAAADARRAVRGDARVHHLDGRFRHHLFRRRRRRNHPAGVHLQFHPHGHIPEDQCDFLDHPHDFHRLRRPVVLPRPTPPLRTCLHEEKTEDRQESIMTYRTPLTLLFAAGLALGGQARAEGTLHFANWSDYYPPELLKKFEKDTGIKATLDAYDSNETLLAKLKAGGGAYDVVVPSDSFIEIFVKEGLLQKLDKSQLPSLGNLKENFRTLGFDPGHDYSIPYLWGTTGYSYDTAKVPGGRLEESWKPFFEPPAELKGKVVALNSIEELFIPATYYLGIDECTEDAREAQKVLDLLLRQKPALAMYNSDGTIERMAAGEVAMHQQWNGAFHRAHAQRASLEYVYPKEGIRLFIDNFAIPRDASNVKEAHVFIDWMMRPENIAAASNFAKYNNAIVGSEKFMEKALFDDPAINTPQDKLDRLKPFKLCSPKALALRSKVWTKLKK
ncbi:Putrescine-binding periplasmic protein precursor [Pseudomonas aeruginosa]|nr:Putrescine-binding periplasmic protein precursor [Pseudomonas aeruginosa]